MTTTIVEEYTLPSGGKMYGKPFDPVVKLRSMTVADEMKRLSSVTNEYKAMCEIIDSCLVTKLPISSYDLYMCDYVYLLQKLRVVTYGPEYNMSYICPLCGNLDKVSIDLDSVEVKRYTDSIKEDMTIQLPASKSVVKLRFQTPRDLDNIARRAKEMTESYPDMGDPTMLLTMESLIESIDSQPVNHMTILDSLKKMPMKDMNYLAKKAIKLQGKVGVDANIKLTCPKCNNSITSTFRYTDEFFGPEVD